MALEFANTVWFTAGSTGTGTWSDGTAEDGYENLASCSLTNNNTTYYRAVDPSDPTIWENGLGTFTSAGPNLARTTILQSSNSDAVVNFTTAPLVALSPMAEFINDLVPTGSPTFDSLTLTGNFQQSKGADVASATALTLGTDGNVFDVTGTTTITSIATLGIGTVVVLHFDAALTLTHNATDLILPGGANITTAAGDEAIFYEYASGDWRCVSYTTAASRPLLESDLGLQTIWIPAGSPELEAASPPASVQLTGTNNTVRVLDFDASTDEVVYFNIALPKNHDDGTLTFRVFWMSEATDTDGVAWALAADSSDDNQTYDDLNGTPVVVTDDNQSAADRVLVTAWSGAVTIADGVGDGDIVFFKFFRDVSDANDDMTEDARLIGIQLRYNTDALKDN